MAYILTDVSGDEHTLSNTSAIEAYLQKPADYWRSGTGECTISLSTQERLIFFKVPEGIFIIQHPDYLVPRYHNSTQKSVTLQHYLGGEFFLFSQAALHSEQQAFEILSSFINSGKLEDRFNWTDLYDFDFENDFN